MQASVQHLVRSIHTLKQRMEGLAPSLGPVWESAHHLSLLSVFFCVNSTPSVDQLWGSHVMLLRGQDDPPRTWKRPVPAFSEPNIRDGTQGESAEGVRPAQCWMRRKGHHTFHHTSTSALSGGRVLRPAGVHTVRSGAVSDTTHHHPCRRDINWPALSWYLTQVKEQQVEWAQLCREFRAALLPAGVAGLGCSDEDLMWAMCIVRSRTFRWESSSLDQSGLGCVVVRNV